MNIKDRVRGSLIGLAIGDALGMPFEKRTNQEMVERFPEGIKGYQSPKDHKYFHDMMPGMWTDDTQLTVAVMKSMIKAKGLDMDEIARGHVEALNGPNVGYGGTTKMAVRLLKNGVHWSESGKSQDPKVGLGNGVPMKIAPLGWYLASKTYLQGGDKGIANFVVDFSAMTHFNKMSALAGTFHCMLTSYCLGATVIHPGIIEGAAYSAVFSEHDNPVFESLHDSDDDIIARLGTLEQVVKNPNNFPDSWPVENYPGNFFYVYNNYPLAVFFFCKYPNTVDCLYKCVMAGGDTDSTASMAGGLLGALNGMALFEKEENKHLLDGLWKKDELIALADEFSDTLGIK